MTAIANYSVPTLSGLSPKTVIPNANIVVGTPYSLFTVPPTNHVLITSTASNFYIHVATSTDTARRWVGMAGTPAVGYELPSGTPPFIGIIAIDTVAQSVAISLNTAGAAGDWINVTGSGAGTTF